MGNFTIFLLFTISSLISYSLAMTKPQFFLLVLILFTSMLRIYELIRAKKNLELRKTATLIEIKESYFFVFILIHTLFLIMVPIEAIILNRNFNLYLGSISLVIYFMCLFIRFHVLQLLGKSWNTKIVFEKEKAEGIITTGIYSSIRHPNYLIVILEIASLSLFHSCYLSFIIFSIANFGVLFFRIRNEEKHLFENKYYKDHFTNKKRFIPYIF